MSLRQGPFGFERELSKGLLALDGLGNWRSRRPSDQSTIPSKILGILYAIKQWSVNCNITGSQLPLVPLHGVDKSIPRMLKCISNGQPSKCRKRIWGTDYNMGIETGITPLTISGVLLYEPMKSIGTLVYTTVRPGLTYKVSKNIARMKRDNPYAF